MPKNGQSLDMPRSLSSKIDVDFVAEGGFRLVDTGFRKFLWISRISWSSIFRPTASSTTHYSGCTAEDGETSRCSRQRRIAYVRSIVSERCCNHNAQSLIAARNAKSPSAAVETQEKGIRMNSRPSCNRRTYCAKEMPSN